MPIKEMTKEDPTQLAESKPAIASTNIQASKQSTVLDLVKPTPETIPEAVRPKAPKAQ
ncbi:MAG: hypothetical protein M1829_001870 [Trizodia sp. TS-e1964]|nr:MAG: hypothetical protein M1829_001870 [Trizodia sp. TS-e1964]